MCERLDFPRLFPASRSGGGGYAIICPGLDRRTESNYADKPDEKVPWTHSCWKSEDCGKIRGKLTLEYICYTRHMDGKDELVVMMMLGGHFEQSRAKNEKLPCNRHERALHTYSTQERHNYSNSREKLAGGEKHREREREGLPPASKGRATCSRLLRAARLLLSRHAVLWCIIRPPACTVPFQHGKVAIWGNMWQITRSGSMASVSVASFNVSPELAVLEMLAPHSHLQLTARLI